MVLTSDSNNAAAMPYLSLDIDRLMPLLDPLGILEDRNISVIQAREVFRTAEETTSVSLGGDLSSSEVLPDSSSGSSPLSSLA
jgi:hypothetical protein